MIDLNAALHKYDVEEQRRVERSVIEYFIGAHEFDVEYMGDVLSEEEKGRFGREIFLSFCSSYYEYEARGFLIEAQSLLNISDGRVDLRWLKQRLLRLKDKLDFAVDFHKYIDERLGEYMSIVRKNVLDSIEPLNQRVQTVS